jgi:hypothetical protein
LRRITKAALGGLAGCALVLGGTQVAVGVIEMFPTYEGDVTDLNLLAESPFDDASVSLQVKKSGDGTNFVLDVTGIDPTFTGEEFGAHLHTHACDDTSVSPRGGPHYNHEIVALGVPKGAEEISRRTEIWFDLVPNVADGVGEARDSTTVKFVPMDPIETPAGNQVMSIILHNAATANKTGMAGARGACFTLDVSEWAETAP